MTVLDSPPATDSANALDVLERTLSAHDTLIVVGDDQIPEAGPVVCAIDASSSARSVARVGKAVSDSLDADLVFAYVDPLADVEHSPASVRAQRRLFELAGANARRVAGTSRVEKLAGGGPDEQMLLDYARERDARLLILGPGVGGLTSLADAPCPVIVVSGAKDRRAAARRA